jgi:hypothetical protein
MSDAEIITIMICFHYGCFRNLKHFYLFYVAEHLQSEFSNLLSYNRFVELERKVIIPFALFLKLICFGQCTGITFIDSTKIAVCKNKRIKRNPFETKREQQERIARAKVDVKYFVETYLKHYATAESADFHVYLASYVKRHKTAKVLVRWGRGLAKSVWCDTIIPLWLWLQDDIHFFIIVGNNFDKAKKLLGDMQAEFEANQLLIHDFGEQITSGSWEKGDFRTKNGFIAKALGMGQSPRGLRVGAQRPDYIVCDDLEDKDTSKNPQRQMEVVIWIEQDLLPTMDSATRRYLHPNNNPFPVSIQGLLEERHPKWKLHRIDACPGAARLPRWAAKYAKNYYAELETELGTLALEAEYNNNPHAEGAVFKDEFVIWDKTPHINHYNHLLAYWDVAYSDAKTADYNAVKVWGLKGVRFYLVNAFVRQCGNPKFDLRSTPGTVAAKPRLPRVVNPIGLQPLYNIVMAR